MPVASSSWLMSEPQARTLGALSWLSHPWYADNATATETSGIPTERNIMRFLFKLVAAVSCSSVVITLLGVEASFISRTMAQVQVKAQAKPAAIAKRKRVWTDQFRLASEGIETITPGDGILVIDCGLRIGQPSERDERWAALSVGRQCR